MSDLTLAREIVFLMGMAFLGGYLAIAFKIPTVVGYLLSGVAASLIFPDLVKNANIATLSEVGVALLMFSLGVEFSFKRLARVREVVVVASILQILAFTVIGLFIFNLLGFDFYSSLFLASVFSLSSTVVVVKILTDAGHLDTYPGELMVGWLVMQDIAVLPMTVILPVIARIFLGMEDGGAVFVLLKAVLKAGFFLYLFLYFGKKLVPAFVSRVAKINSRELLVLSVFSLCLVFALFFKAFGLSFALGAFLAGVLVSDSTENHAIFSEIRPLRDVFSILFFVFLGLMFSPSFFVSHLAQIGGLTFLVITLKFIIVLVLCLLYNQHLSVSFIAALGMVQVGEFAFVLATDALARGYISIDIYSIVLSVALLSLLLTPIIYKSSFKAFSILREFARMRLPRLYEKFFSTLSISVLKEGLPISDHVVLCGHGRVGHQISRVLDLAKIPYVVVDYNSNVVRKLKRSGRDVVYGDPTDIEVLDYAQVDKAQVVVVALPDRHSQEMVIGNSLRLNPRVSIICRSHFEDDAKRLIALGAHNVILPEFEAGLSISHKLLELFGFSQKDTASFLKLLRNEFVAK